MRKLAIASFAFSAAVFAANFIFGRVAALYAALFCAVVGALLLSLRLKSIRALIIAAFAASFGLLVFCAHYDLSVERAHSLSRVTKELSFELLENPKSYENYSCVEARITTKGSSHLRCLLYDSDGGINKLKAGDRITATVSLSAADIRYGQKTSRYTSKDIYLTGTLKQGFAYISHVISPRSAAGLVTRAIEIRIGQLFPADTAPFFRALSLGDKSDLYDRDALYVSLSRAGLMHIVAVSGMHVSYLLGFLRLVFGKGRRSALFCILMIWAFVAVTGLSPSAVRAAFMQTILLLAPLFGREDDPLTSLGAALAFLLLHNPFAAESVSLQLSFAAMLGVVTVGESLADTIYERMGEENPSRILRYPVSVLCSSIGVMVFTIPISAFHFGYVTLLSPVSNLLCLWAVPICFLGAFIVCILGFIPAVGTIAASMLSVLARYIFWIGEKISSLVFSVVYLSHSLLTIWIVLFYVSLSLVFLLKLKIRWKIIIPTATAIVSLLISHFGLIWYYSAAEGTVTAVDVGQGQCITAFTRDGTVMVDCGSISYGEYNAGDEAAAYLISCGRKRIDTLILTHLHSDHVNGFERLFNLMEIGKLVIPENASYDNEVLEEIVLCAVRHGIRIEGVSGNSFQRAGDVGILLLDPNSKGDGNEYCMPVVLTVGKERVIITGDAPASTEKMLVNTCELSEVDILVVGHHGSKSASCREFLGAIGGRRAIISVGKNSFGHPATETLERLASFGYTVFRTDTDGNVEIRIHG